VKHQLALVTGASSGIGLELCRRLSQKGLFLILTGRHEGRLGQLAKELPGSEVVVADLATEQGRKTLVSLINERLPDLVINNAGYGLLGDIVSHGAEKQLDLVRVDVEAVLEITVEAAAALKEKGQPGTIINISSAASFQPYPYFAAYAASKAFVTSFSEAVNHELKPYGIDVLVSCPGWIDTPFGVRASGGKPRRKPAKRAMTVDFAVDEILWQIEKKKPVHTFDWRYRLAVWAGKYVVPKRVAFYILKKAATSQG
jgi:short-subunit dehydrogenase